MRNKSLMLTIFLMVFLITPAVAGINLGWDVYVQPQPPAQPATSISMQSCLQAAPPAECTNFSDLVSVPITQTTYNDTAAVASTCYRIRANGPDGQSPYSNVACGTPTTPPTAPANLTLSFTDDTHALLQWPAVVGATGYVLQACTPAAGVCTMADLPGMPTTALTFTHTMAVNEVDCYQVCAENSAGRGAFSLRRCGLGKPLGLLIQTP